MQSKKYGYNVEIVCFTNKCVAHYRCKLSENIPINGVKTWALVTCWAVVSCIHSMCNDVNRTAVSSGNNTSNVNSPTSNVNDNDILPPNQLYHEAPETPQCQSVRVQQCHSSSVHVQRILENNYSNWWLRKRPRLLTNLLQHNYITEMNPLSKTIQKDLMTAN